MRTSGRSTLSTRLGGRAFALVAFGVTLAMGRITLGAGFALGRITFAVLMAFGRVALSVGFALCRVTLGCLGA